MPRTEALKLLSSLNEKQSSILYKIRQWCIQKVLGQNPDPFHVFISGGAGTGKSHLIKAIYYETCRILSKLSENPDETHVLLTAPTGVAAYNINGETIHHSFSIPIDAEAKYHPLGQDKINTLRTKLGNLQILIIDEASMIDHKLMRYVNGRIRPIKQTGDYSPFGNICVIAVGDFYQLPPVKGKALYTEPTDFINLWADNFALAELTDIVRQKDAEFSQLLNRLRKHPKKQSLEKSDMHMLQQCETGEGEESDALHIYATNAQVDDHNFNMLNKTCSDIIGIDAEDYENIAKNGKLQKKTGSIRVYQSCLPKTLSLGEGARVMLLKNVDTSDGLVNGACGTVSKVFFNDNNKKPSMIYVTFDDEKVGKAVRCKKPCPQLGFEKATPIEPNEDRKSNTGATRRQFPLRLAWACTVHKVQGLTVEKAVVSLKKIFTAGQAYVALSRVTTIQGLIIEDFDPKAIYSNDKIEKALQEMRAFIKPSTQVSVPSCKILLHNVQGLSSHVQCIRQDTRYTEADIICVTETWLAPNNCNDDTHVNGFVFHNKPRHLAYDTNGKIFAELREQQHGGVGIYCKENMQCHVTDVPCMNIECLPLYIPQLKTQVAVIYRPSSYQLSTFCAKLNDLIVHMNMKTGGKIILGDFNENLMVANSIRTQMEKHGFSQVVNEPTTEKGTLIDHIYIKDIDTKNICINIMPTYFSYHECVELNWY